jgi:hypothetical protein
MVTSKIAQLSETDLDYLDQLLHREFSKQCNNSTQWKTKNNSTYPYDNSKQLVRLMDAVRSQKKLLTMPKW